MERTLHVSGGKLVPHALSHCSSLRRVELVGALSPVNHIGLLLPEILLPTFVVACCHYEAVEQQKDGP